ncbi:MAG: hypothetical protein Q9191_000396 [Dirinaria sp. TL-2023a]
MARASGQHHQDSPASDFIDEENREHSDLTGTQPPMDLSEILEPNDNNYALQQSNGYNTEDLPAHSENETFFADNDLTTMDFDLVGAHPAASDNDDFEMMDLLQQALTGHSRREPTVTGAGAIFKDSQHIFDNPPGLFEPTADRRSVEPPNTIEEGESDYVKASNSSDDDDASTFRQAKKAYKAKCKAGQNTQEDDILFKVANEKEKTRLASIKPENLRGWGPVDSDDSDEAVEENFQPLFVPLHDTDKSVRKRRRSVGSEKASDDEELDSRPKRARATHLNKYYEEERLRSMLAGIEEILAKIKRKEESKAKKANDTMHNNEALDERDGANLDGGTNATPNEKRKVNKSKPVGAANSRTLGSLLSSNVFEDAAANANEPALPVDTEVSKSKAMTSLIASMPIEDRRAAGSDKQRILKATRNLGFRAVATDGEGKWTLKVKLIKSYPDCQLPPELKRPNTTEEEVGLSSILDTIRSKAIVQVKAWWTPIWEKERKELHRVHFYRVGECYEAVA